MIEFASPPCFQLLRKKKTLHNNDLMELNFRISMYNVANDNNRLKRFVLRRASFSPKFFTVLYDLLTKNNQHIIAMLVFGWMKNNFMILLQLIDVDVFQSITLSLYVCSRHFSYRIFIYDLHKTANQI